MSYLPLEGRAIQPESKTSPQETTDDYMDYGYVIFTTILNVLFPNRNKNGVIDGTPDFDINSTNFTNCFEDGSFVFNDPSHKLFNILLGANTDEELRTCRLNESVVANTKDPLTGSFDVLRSTSHMLLNQLSDERKDQINIKWKISQLAYDHNNIPGTSTKEKAVYVKKKIKKIKRKTFTRQKYWKHNGSTAIYERFITPKGMAGIEAICNPKNPDMPNTSFLKKRSGKKLLKFYCLEFEKKPVPGTENKAESKNEVETYYLTFVKSETTPHGSTASRTIIRDVIEKSLRRINQINQFVKMGSDIDDFALPFSPESSEGREAYPYRKDSLQSPGEDEQFDRARLNDNFNKYFNGARVCNSTDELQCHTESSQYSGNGIITDGQESIPFMRASFEFFVPSPITKIIVDTLEPVKKVFCSYKYHNKQPKSKKPTRANATSREDQVRVYKDNQLILHNAFKAAIANALATHALHGGGKIKRKTKRRRRYNKKKCSKKRMKQKVKKKMKRRGKTKKKIKKISRLTRKSKKKR
tara:strand:- start:8476 stop:10059 length:1584 start_codon:yes stop_codon:yes gene_type:complete